MRIRNEQKIMSAIEEQKKSWWALLVRRYFDDDLGMRASALAYNLLFSVFPLLIVISNLVGFLHINPQSVFNSLKTILPSEVIELLTGYLNYVNNSSNVALMIFAIVFSIWFPFRAISSLMDTIRYAFRKTEHGKPRFLLAKELLCTFLLPFTILVSLVLIVMGRNAILFLTSLIPEAHLHISEAILDSWSRLRFLIAGAMMAVALGFVYKMSLQQKISFRKLLPGAAAAILCWLLASLVFSAYTENFANYSLIYGTLGAMIVTMMWLFLTGLILIMGAELNAILLQKSEERKAIRLWKEKEQDREEKAACDDGIRP